MDELEDKKIKAFNLASLKSSIQKQFKDAHYSENVQESDEIPTPQHSQSKDEN
jgi:hypothetical protein